MTNGDYMAWYAENDIAPDDSVGSDEVGRGSLAGPVVAATVWISENLILELEKNFAALPIRDSKKMTPKHRQKIVTWIKKQSPNFIRCAIAAATVEEIDELNILNATLLAMKRAHNILEIHGPKIILVDGNAAPQIPGAAVKTVIGGDAKVLAIALASVVAKEYRDNHMRELSQKYPYYSWDKNVGYGTAAHLEAIRQHGITPHHRRSFAPIKLRSKSIA
ncbi:MAG: ribonuclease HII [Holosporaceae bacterium]|jgi:ribonuclease HII|nr:ribonuclease HII [Holosporaceae bacterium]